MRFTGLIILVLLMWGAVGRAQGVYTGKVYEYKTRVVLAGVQVENQTTKQSAVTDNKGTFAIKAKLNDILILKLFAYQPDTVVVTNFKLHELFMQPQSFGLKEVKVNALATAQPAKINAMSDPDFHGQTMRYQTDEAGNYKGGVVMRLWDSHSGEKKRQQDAQREHSFAVGDEITKVFTPETVGKYVPLKGQELDDFIGLYIPTVKEYSAPGFNLADYLNACYVKYLKLPPEKRHPAKIGS